MLLCPRKYLIKDLLNIPLPIDVWIQGTIEQTVGTDILIVSDTSGKSKITKIDTADGVTDKKSLVKGTYCCIIGTLVSSKGLPEIQASKFVDLSTCLHMKTSWEIEVKEANLYLEDKVIPTVNTL